MNHHKLLVFVVMVTMVAWSAINIKADTIFLDESTIGALRARNIGPATTSGRITEIKGNPKDSRVIYVGTAGGGVWKTTNGGITFKPIFDRYTMSIGCLELDPNNPDIVWVGTGETNVRNSVSVGDGLYKSTDGGETWKRVGFDDSERIAEVRIVPGNSDLVYACVLGHLWNDHDTRGVYKSTDGGNTWKRVLFVDAKTGCIDLEIDPQQPEIMFASMWQVRRWPWFFKSGGPGSGLYRSEDGGEHWVRMNNGLPEGELGRIEIAVAPSRPATLYAIVEAKETALYRSDDTGIRWKKAFTGLGVQFRPFYMANLVVDPQDHNRVYNPSFFLQFSEDGGRTFSSPLVAGSLEESFGGAIHGDNQALWIDPINSNTLVLGTDGGVYVSYNKGGNWKFIHNLPVSQFYHVSVDDAEPYHICGGLQDNGSWCGPSRTFSSNGIQNKDWFNVGGGDGFYVTVDPTDPNIVYNSWQGGHLQWHNLKTGETRDIMPRPGSGEPPYRYNWNSAFALSPNHRGRIYFGAQFLFRSDDRGQTWVKISPDLTTNDPTKQRQEESGGLTLDNTTAENHCTIFSIAESPVNDQVIWVCTDDGQIQVTTNGGQSWSNVTLNIPGLPHNTWCSSVEPSHFNQETAYAVFDGHRTGDMSTYIFKTDNMGKSWKSLVTSELSGYAHVIREDLVNPKLLFLGTEFGLFITLDGGEHWVHYKESFPTVAIRDMVIHPRTHDLVLATHGRGIYIIDDISPLRSLNEDVLNAEAAVLPSRPSVMRETGYIQEFPGQDGYFAPNPPDGAVITYYLKKRHIFGSLNIEILDSEGNLVKKLPTTKRKGINRVFWNMRLRPPKTASARGLSGAMFSQGPRVAEGTYTVRLVKGDKAYTGKIELMADAATGHSPEDRKLRHEIIMKLYTMQEHLAYVADTLATLREQATQLLEEFKKQKKQSGLQKKLEAFISAISEFRGRLVQEKGFLAGDKLREKVLELYGSILGFGGRPTEAQMRYVDFLAEELKKADLEFQSFRGKKLEPINSALIRVGKKPFNVITEEDYRKKRDEES